MDTEQRIRRLESTLALVVHYINRYNITNVVTVDHLRSLSLRREEAIHRHGINFEYNNNRSHSSSDCEAENEIDGFAAVYTSFHRNLLW